MHNSFECDGYSRLSITVFPAYQARNGTYDATFYVSSIFWDNSLEYLPTSALNVTFYVNNGTMTYGSLRPPFFIETKGRYCQLNWSVLDSHNLPPDWWLTFYVNAYLRNE
jgi:hypothetical protein